MVMATLPYDPLKDLAPNAIGGTSPQQLFAPLQRSRSLAELVAAAKASPGAISIANVGAGSLIPLLGVILETQAGVKFNHIPYQGVSHRHSRLDLSAGRLCRKLGVDR